MPTRHCAKASELLKYCLVVVCVGILGNCRCVAEEVWVIPHGVGKGNDYLFVVDPSKDIAPPFRRLRCQESLPIYIEQLERAVSRIGGQVLMRVDVEVFAEPGGERAKIAGIKMICVAPKGSLPILDNIKNWSDFSERLGNEIAEDPFRPRTWNVK